MKGDYRTKFDTRSGKFGNETIQANLLTWLENGFLIALTLSFILSKYIPFLNSNSMTATFLRYYTIAFVALQAVFKAVSLYNNVIKDKTTNLTDRKNLYRILAFTGAFAVAMIGIFAFNKNSNTVPDILKAVGMSVFPFSLTEVFEDCDSYMDLMMNGVYAILLCGGLTLVYFGKNWMGVCCAVALILRGFYGFMKSRLGTKEVMVKRDVMLTMGLGLMSVVVVLVCHFKGISMGLPVLSGMFKKVVENAGTSNGN